ncbi:hypothetical protein [Streptomyces sp. NPDC086766]|uniref:hypothetical protein n=1 Tax=Streptomyces sp. NPDC086766 TaxID=3365754 RepID=UPI00381E50DD
MTHLRALPGLLLAATLLVGCESGTSSPESSETFSGPAWDAYKDGRTFGGKHQAEGLPTLNVDPSEGVTSDTYMANSDEAEKWCKGNLPDELWVEHEGHEEALTDGCVGGVYPLADHPGELLPFDD